MSRVAVVYLSSTVFQSSHIPPPNPPRDSFGRFLLISLTKRYFKLIRLTSQGVCVCAEGVGAGVKHTLFREPFLATTTVRG